MFFFFNDTATTEIYTLSLHDALPISAEADRDRLSHDHRAVALEAVSAALARLRLARARPSLHGLAVHRLGPLRGPLERRSEEHTSELQSRLHLVCRLLLEKKKKQTEL